MSGSVSSHRDLYRKEFPPGSKLNERFRPHHDKRWELLGPAKDYVGATSNPSSRTGGLSKTFPHPLNGGCPRRAAILSALAASPMMNEVMVQSRCAGGEQLGRDDARSLS